MSAGSCTAPGGYASEEESTPQFVIDDDRTAAEVEKMIQSKGYETVWKDWDRAFLDNRAV
jgi:2-iminoacetate synthase